MTNVLNKKGVSTVLLVILAISFLMFFSGVGFASNEGSNLPWNTGLDTLIEAFSGRTAILVTCVGLFVLAGMAIFGGDLGVVGKGLMMVILAGSILSGLMTVATHFLTEGFCL